MSPDLSSRPLLDTRPDASLFIDREAEVDLVLRINRTRLNAIVFGERGIGKTSFLRRIQYRLRQGKVPTIFVDGSLPEDALDILELVRYQVAGTRTRSRSILPQHLLPEEISSEPEQLLRSVRILSQALDDGLHRTVLLDNPSPIDAHTLFGRLRDELWRLPLNWVVTADDDRRWQYLQPPADAFFEHVVDLDPLSGQAAKALLEKRMDKSELKMMDVPKTIELAKGNPRQLITLARASLEADATTSAIEERRAELQRRLAGLGRAATMLVSELEALGPVSASDERLLKRLGWTRPRAVQVLKQLEEEGIVTSSDESSESSGRPRKVYNVVQKVLG
ncbi:MAG: ATP-binding protein [Actinomycetota bacterium]|nr:ATP-binding protein [Actinomycetota bacterium]